MISTDIDESASLAASQGPVIGKEREMLNYSPTNNLKKSAIHSNNG